MHSSTSGYGFVVSDTFKTIGVFTLLNTFFAKEISKVLFPHRDEDCTELQINSDALQG